MPSAAAVVEKGKVKVWCNVTAHGRGLPRPVADKLRVCKYCLRNRSNSLRTNLPK